MESKTQTKLIKFLKKKGCYVLKTRPGPGVPTGCPDVIFMLEGFWGGAECKALPNSKRQTLQPETVAKLDKWSWCKFVHSENIDEIIQELDKVL